MKKLKINIIILIIAALCLYGCSASFDSVALSQDEDAKQKVLSLVSKANKSYRANETEVQQLTSELNGYKAYESRRSNNDETIKMWQKMMSPVNNFYGGFIKKWKEKDSLSTVFIDEYKPVISDAFDEIIGLEKAKK